MRLNRESVLRDDREEEIDEIIERLKSTNSNMVKTVEDREIEFRYIINFILSNYTFLIRQTSKKQKVFSHYISSDQVHNAVKQFLESVNCKHIAYFKRFLGKILKSIYPEIKLVDIQYASGRFWAYLHLVKREISLEPVD